MVLGALALASPGGGDHGLRVLRMGTSVEGIAFPLATEIGANPGAMLALPILDVTRNSPEALAAFEANAIDSKFWSDGGSRPACGNDFPEGFQCMLPSGRHRSSYAVNENGVNSGNNFSVESTGHTNYGEVNPEPSRKGNFSEGVTSRGRGYSVKAMPVTPPRARWAKAMMCSELHGDMQKRRVNGSAITTLTPQDSETSVRYPWAQDYGTISISLTEEKKNQGRGKLIDILNQKIDDAMTSLKDLLNTQLLATAPAAGSKDPISLTEIVQTTPATSPARVASIGNISGTAQSWWRNRATNGGAFSVSDMNTMYNTVSDGTDFPQMLLTSQTVFEYYENSQVGQIRYSDTKTADAGFQNLLFKQTPILWDPLIGITDSMYFLNFKYLRLAMMTGMDFMTTDFVEPDNQAAKTAKILFMGNLTCTARRRQGTLYSITAPA